MIFVMTPESITLKLEGFERFWSCKSKVRLPADSIESIEYSLSRPHPPGGCWIKLGAAIPQVLFAGTFTKKDTKEFWYLRFRKRGVLTITLKKDHARYDKVCLSVHPLVADDVLAWWDGR